MKFCFQNGYKLIRANYWVFFLLNPLFIAIYILSLQVSSFPVIGHDYEYFIPRLLDTHQYQLLNGFSAQWFTPGFGAGLPAFPNPQHLQYTLPQILLFIVPPLLSIQISLLFYIIIGFFASYRFFLNVFGLHWTSSIIGAVIFSANGFFIERVIIGHFGYFTFPFLSLLILILLDKSISTDISLILFGIIYTIIIHHAGFYLLVIFFLSKSITLLLIYAIKPQILSMKRVISIFIIGYGLAILLSASKLSAIFSFMRYFPREIATEFKTNLLLSPISIASQLLGTMNLIPIAWVVGINPEVIPIYMRAISNQYYGYWEFDMSLTPITFFLLLVSLFKIPSYTKKLLASNAKFQIHILILLFFVLWITTELISANGFLYHTLNKFPILKSLHVNIRFTAILIFPLSLIATLSYQDLVSTKSEKSKLFFFVITNILALLPLSLYQSPIVKNAQSLTYNISSATQLYQDIISGKNLVINFLVYIEEDTPSLAKQSSNINTYEPIFGYRLENFDPLVRVGSIWQVEDGYLNMSNPSSYIFPAENKLQIYERFRSTEILSLKAFSQYKKFDFVMPAYQVFCNATSSVMMLFVLFYLILSVKKSFHLANKSKHET